MLLEKIQKERQEAKADTTVLPLLRLRVCFVVIVCLLSISAGGPHGLSEDQCAAVRPAIRGQNCQRGGHLVVPSPAKSHTKAYADLAIHYRR